MKLADPPFIRANNFLATRSQLWDNYVMRSTRNVVAENSPGLGHYSDLLLPGPANQAGPARHAMIEMTATTKVTPLGFNACMGRSRVWNNRVGSSHSGPRNAAGLTA